MTEEDKTAEDAATQAGQGKDAEVRATRSRSEAELSAPAASPAKRRRRKGMSRRRARRKHPDKVLRLTTYERLGEYLERSPGGTSTS